MANEAVPVEGPYTAHDFTVATGTAIVQYSLMELSDPRTVVISSGANVFGGIAATEKTTTDGVINMGCFTTGTYVLLDSGAGIAVGAQVMLAGANTIKTADAAGIAAGKNFGVALEAIGAGTTGEVRLIHN